MQPLSVRDNGCAVCPSGHSYDKSSRGYYNLLLSNAGGTHGDNAEMVGARRAFLDTGAYLPLANAVAELAREYSFAGCLLLDIGCGEGYYTDIVYNRLAEGGARPLLHAFDISKNAVISACKRNKNLNLAVASAYKMPLAASSVDIAINIFSPLAREETVRVLRDGGKFIMAIPDEEHLFGLKSAVYKTPYKNEVASTDISGLRLIKTQKLSYKLTLDTGEKIRNLFMMTPYAYRTPRADRERVLAMEHLETEIAFIVFVYEK